MAITVIFLITEVFNEISIEVFKKIVTQCQYYTQYQLWKAKALSKAKSPTDLL